MQTSKGKLFHGWIIVLAGFFIMFFSMGATNNTAGLLIKPVCEQFGYTRQAFTLTVTANSTGHMLFALLSGRILSRFNVHQVMKAGSIMMALSTFAYSFSTALPVFYFWAFMIGFSMACITNIPIALVVGNWFFKRRGLALGLALTGSGAGGMAFNALLGALIPRLGWAVCYRILSAIMFVTLIPLAFFVIRETPQEMGLAPYGEGRVISAEEVRELPGMMKQEALHSKAFWILILSAVPTNIASGVMVANMPAYLTDIGFSYAFGAMIASLGMGSLAVGKTLLGQVYDKIGARMGTIFASSCTLISLFCAIFARQCPFLLIIYVLLIGTGAAFGSVSGPILTRALFGQKDYAAIVGIISFFYSGSGMLQPVIASGIYDHFGSYIYAFLLFVVISILCAIMFFGVLPSKKQEDEAERLAAR